MTKLKYWLAISGWVLNSCLRNTRLNRIPLVRSIWSAGKRSLAPFLASGSGVRITLDGQVTYVHPLSVIYGTEAYEPYTSELFKSAIKPGSTVLDIGAHHGYFSILAAREVGENGQVYALEPVPKNFQILTRNIELNGFNNVLPINKAVSDQNTTLPFYFRSETGTGGSLLKTDRTNEESVNVECVTIDDLLDGRTVNVLKMDVEGFEPRAIIGMQRTLSQVDDLVLFLELAPDHLKRAGGNQIEYLKQLEQAGLQCQFISEDRRSLLPTSTELIPEQGFSKGYCNIYCIKSRSSR